jgi:hypothetical protein
MPDVSDGHGDERGRFAAYMPREALAWFAGFGY